MSRKEEWVELAELDEEDQIRFTAEFRAMMGNLGWEAKAFVGHLLGLWCDPFEHMLDYTSGEAAHSQDQRLTKTYQPDFICYDQIVVEIKAISGLTGLEEAQTINNLKASKLNVGILINFGAKSLEYKRLVYNL